MDLTSITAGLAAVKSGFDTAKTALSLAKDAKDLLPVGNERKQIEVAITDASAKMAEGESAVAIGLGYTLCRCAYPPTVMLKVGTIPLRHLSGFAKAQVMGKQPGPGGGLTDAIAVHECPRCGETDAPGYTFERTAPPRSNS